MEHPICIECKHCASGLSLAYCYREWYCTRRVTRLKPILNKITGDNERVAFSCVAERMWPWRCGKRARWFEPKGGE